MIFTELQPGQSGEHEEIKIFRSDRKAKRYVYLLGGVHGTDIEGVYLIQKVYEWLSSDHSMKDYPMVIVPILNVDGYRSMTKVNAFGVDLLGNFLMDKSKRSEIQPEILFLKNTTRKFRPGLVIYFSSGKAKIIYDKQSKDMASFISKLNSYHLEAEDDIENVDHLKHYFMQKHQSQVIEFSCPKITKDLSLENLWQHNEKALKELILSDKLETIVDPSS